MPGLEIQLLPCVQLVPNTTDPQRPSFHVSIILLFKRPAGVADPENCFKLGIFEVDFELVSFIIQSEGWTVKYKIMWTNGMLPPDKKYHHRGARYNRQVLYLHDESMTHTPSNPP